MSIVAPIVGMSPGPPEEGAAPPVDGREVGGVMGAAGWPVPLVGWGGAGGGVVLPVGVGGAGGAVAPVVGSGCSHFAQVAEPSGF